MRRSIQMVVALLLTTFVGQVAFAQPAKLDLKFIPNDAVAAVIARPQALLTQPTMELMPLEVITAAGIHELGIDPLDVEQFILIAGQPTVEKPPAMGFIARFSKPYDWDKISEKVRSTVGEIGFTVGGMAGPQTLVMAQPGMAAAMRGADGTGDGPLLTALRKLDASPHLQAIVSFDAARDFVDQTLEEAPDLPPPFDQFKKAPELTSSIQLGLHVGEQLNLDLALDGRDEAAGKELERLLEMALLLGKQAALAQMANDQELSDPDDPVQLALQQYSRRLLDTLFGRLTPKRDGNRVAINLELDAGASTLGIAVALMLPAVQAAREAARRMESTNNLKQIAIAFHNYHDIHNRLPTLASRDDNGEPLLSWRVAILPLIEQQQLYEQFHLDEPWDSEHNLKLVENMPAVYNNPNFDEPGKTIYLAISGKGTALDGPNPKFANILDGLANTILAVEADPSEAVVWTKPADWEFDPEKPMRGLGHVRPGGFSAVFVDGSVHFISQQVDPGILRALMTARGGEQADLP